MHGLKPDTTVFEQLHSQPEFNEQIWQYLNRRVSDWRIVTGKEKAKEYAPLLARIEQDFGVERSVMMGIWGIESAYGDPLVQQNHMRPVIPALAALAWGEPRRRTYWEQELLNALVIINRGWGTPEEMNGSWAGAMGHTQWMPEVWLNMGFDYDGDGRVSPFGKPDDALGSTARYLVERGKYHRGEHWGYEVRAAGAIVDTGAGRSSLSARTEFLRRALLQSIDELHALHRASRRPDHGRRAVHAEISRQRTSADACRSAGNPAPVDRAWLRHRRYRRPGRQ
jgi:lytic murein transglycosylase